MGQRAEKDKVKSRKEKLAGYFYDLSKLTFAALVLGGMSSFLSNDYKFESIMTFVTGIAFTYASAFLANRILKY